MCFLLNDNFVNRFKSVLEGWGCMPIGIWELVWLVIVTCGHTVERFVGLRVDQSKDVELDATFVLDEIWGNSSLSNCDRVFFTIDRFVRLAFCAYGLRLSW